MSSVKLIFRESKEKKDGTIPFYIRITRNRKSKFVYTGISITKEQFDSKNNKVKKHKNSARMNALLSQKVAEAQNVALELEGKDKYVTTEKIKNQIVGKRGTSFTKYYKDYLAELLSKDKHGTHDKANAVFSKFKTYVKSAEIQFDEIDYDFLKKYEAYLRDNLGNGVNTIHSNLKIFRKLFNDAIREKLIDYDYNPFLTYKLKTEKTKKEHLTEAEIKRMEELELPIDSTLELTRDLYVFACYVGGIRISDLITLKWGNFDGTHINFTMQKTKEIISIQVPKKGIEILNYYSKGKNPSDNRIFPILENKEYSQSELFRIRSSKSAYINSNLKTIATKAKIEKKISFHTSRHTFATRALRKGMRIEHVSKLVGHSNIKTTQIYAKIVNEELDKAMDVFDE